MLARSFPQTGWCAPIVIRNSSAEEQQTKINARRIAVIEIHHTQNGTRNSIDGTPIWDYSE